MNKKFIYSCVAIAALQSTLMGALARDTATGAHENGTAAAAKSKSTDNAAGETTSAAEKTLMKNIAADGMLEVRLGQLAEKRAKDASVKNFAKQMVEDHSKANEELKQAASKKGVELPQDLPAAKKQKETMLEKTAEAAFDRNYMSTMVKGHAQAIAAVKKATTTGTTDFKAWATKTLPVIEHHSEEAKQILSKLPK